MPSSPTGAAQGGASNRPTWAIGTIGALVLAGLFVYVRGGGPDPDDVLAAYAEGAGYATLRIAYPLNGTLFPPGIPSPTFRWADETPGVTAWVVGVAFEDGPDRLAFAAAATTWTPPEEVWERVKRWSRSGEAG